VERIAGWSARHRKTVVFGWLALVAIVFVAGQMISSKNVPSNDPGQAGRAEQALQRLNISGPPPAESVLIQSRTGAGFSADQQQQQAARQVVAALQALPRSSASDIRSPLSHGSQGLVSADGRSALVSFDVTGSDEDQAVQPAQRAVAAVQAAHPGLVVRETGDASTDRVANQLLSHDFRKAESTSLPVTLVLLVLVFGALIAAGIPLLLAATAVVTAISLLSVVGQWLPTGQSTSEVVLILGMAVGIDYALFYLRREREERARGRGTGQSLRIAAATSGRAIVVSGLTVMTALAGLFLTGYSVFSGVAIGTIAVVGVSVIGALTVLPALLSWLGPKADRGRIPFLGRRRTASRPSRLWAALVRRVVRRPVIWGGVAAVAMLALAAPALGMKLDNPPNGGFASNPPVVQTLNSIQRAFPQAPSPAEVVVTGRNLASPAVRNAIAVVRHAASPSGPIRLPVTAEPAAGGRAMLVSVPLSGNGTDAKSDHALATLREQVLPRAFAHTQGVSWAVTGLTANNHDDIAALHSRTPLVLAVVSVLALVLLLLAFRSLAISLVSVGLNLLSVAAAFGLITLVFQDGWLHQKLGFSSYGGIVPWVPLFIFVFLFGLSMDYHVFILSRIRELHSRGAATKDAVVDGIASSAGVVTSAAVIMVAVFSILATLSIITLKMVGIGLAVAVLIDATIVRGVLVPAALALLGERSWALPRWLAWLPGRSLQHVPAPASAALASAALASPVPAGPVPASPRQAGYGSAGREPGRPGPAGSGAARTVAGQAPQ
jgi:RND superfamily putative drug exporter